jgi:hypothetical protein
MYLLNVLLYNRNVIVIQKTRLLLRFILTIIVHFRLHIIMISIHFANFIPSDIQKDFGIFVLTFFKLQTLFFVSNKEKITFHICQNAQIRIISQIEINTSQLLSPFIFDYYL